MTVAPMITPIPIIDPIPKPIRSPERPANMLPMAPARIITRTPMKMPKAEPSFAHSNKLLFFPITLLLCEFQCELNYIG